MTSVVDGRVNVVLWTARRPAEFLSSALIEPSGRFTALVPQEIMREVGHQRIHGEALCLGTTRWAPCRSGERTIG